MIGIVLAGGMGTRLKPATKYINKHILLVGEKPMIYYPIWTLVRSGIKKIIVVTGKPFSRQVETVVRELKFEGAKFEFVCQPKAKGLPDAIRMAKAKTGKEAIIVVGGDNIFGGDYAKHIKQFKSGCVSFLRKVKDPSRFGVAEFDHQGNIVKLVEKPKKPKTNLAICGPHIFDERVFKMIKHLKLSSRGEYEIVDLFAEYLKLKALSLVKVNDYWSDMGTPTSLAETSYKLINNKVKFRT